MADERFARQTRKDAEEYRRQADAELAELRAALRSAGATALPGLDGSLSEPVHEPHSAAPPAARGHGRPDPGSPGPLAD